MVLLYCYYNPSRVLRGFSKNFRGTLEGFSKNSAKTCEPRQNYIGTNTGKYSFLCIFDPEKNLSQSRPYCEIESGIICIFRGLPYIISTTRKKEI
jgi:hypothetical protein